MHPDIRNGLIYLVRHEPGAFDDENVNKICRALANLKPDHRLTSDALILDKKGYLCSAMDVDGDAIAIYVDHNLPHGAVRLVGCASRHNEKTGLVETGAVEWTSLAATIKAWSGAS
jgi:hypothetical protein